MVFKKGMALSPLHARQLIVHGHVEVGTRTIKIPGYGINRVEEAEIKLVGLKEPKAEEGGAPQSTPEPAAQAPQAAPEEPAAQK